MLTQLTSLLGLTQTPENAQGKERVGVDIDFAQVFSSLEEDAGSDDGDLLTASEEGSSDEKVAEPSENIELSEESSGDGERVEDHVAIDAASRVDGDDFEALVLSEHGVSAVVDRDFDPTAVRTAPIPRTEPDSRSVTRNASADEKGYQETETTPFEVSDNHKFTSINQEVGRIDKIPDAREENLSNLPQTVGKLRFQADVSATQMAQSPILKSGEDQKSIPMTPWVPNSDEKEDFLVPFFSNRKAAPVLPVNEDLHEKIGVDVSQDQKILSIESQGEREFSQANSTQKTERIDTLPAIPDVGENAPILERPSAKAQENTSHLGNTRSQDIGPITPVSGGNTSISEPIVTRTTFLDSGVRQVIPTFTSDEIRLDQGGDLPAASAGESKVLKVNVGSSDLRPSGLNMVFPTEAQGETPSRQKVDLGALPEKMGISETLADPEQKFEINQVFSRNTSGKEPQSQAPVPAPVSQIETSQPKKAGITVEQPAHRPSATKSIQIPMTMSHPSETKPQKDVLEITRPSEQPRRRVIEGNSIEIFPIRRKPEKLMVSDGEVETKPPFLVGKNVSSDKTSEVIQVLAKDALRSEIEAKHEIGLIDDSIDENPKTATIDEREVREEAPKVLSNGTAPTAVPFAGNLEKAALPDVREKNTIKPNQSISEAPDQKLLNQVPVSVNHPFLVGLDDDVDGAEFSALSMSLEPRQTSSISPGSNPLPATRHDVSHMIRQISDGIQKMSEGGVELRLSPEELGPVRMQFFQSEQGLSVHIAAERPETLDLIRRHIDQLAKDLAESGFDAAGFTFGEQGAQGDQDQFGASGGETGIEDQPQPDQPVSVVHDGLDIRV